MKWQGPLVLPIKVIWHAILSASWAFRQTWCCAMLRTCEKADKNVQDKHDPDLACYPWRSLQALLEGEVLPLEMVDNSISLFVAVFVRIWPQFGKELALSPQNRGFFVRSPANT